MLGIGTKIRNIKQVTSKEQIRKHTHAQKRLLYCELGTIVNNRNIKQVKNKKKLQGKLRNIFCIKFHEGGGGNINPPPLWPPRALGFKTFDLGVPYSVVHFSCLYLLL